MITTNTYNLQNRANWLQIVGNSIEYTKDAQGNIITEIYKAGEAVAFVIHNEYDTEGNITRSYTTNE